MHSRVYETAERPSVCLFRYSATARLFSGFAAVGPVDKRYQSIAAWPGSQQRMQAASDCQLTYKAEHRLLIGKCDADRPEQTDSCCCCCCRHRHRRVLLCALWHQHGLSFIVFGLGWHTWHHLPQVHLSFSVRHHFFHSDLCSIKIVKLMLLLTRQVETRWPDSYRFSWLLKPASSYLAKGLQHLSRHFWQVKDVLATSYCTFTFVMSYPSLLFFTMHEV